MDLLKQNISKEANSILISLFRDYFATQRQKEILENLLKQNQQNLEHEKNKKYNSNSIFKDKNRKLTIDEKSIVILDDKDSIFTKIIKWFKHFFNTIGK